ncbi:MAG TPA: MFS transporter, partial [Jatrophihabitantaceae bacterium]
MAVPDVVYRSAQGRWVLLATILGSGMAQLDGTVVNVALPRIGEDLHAGLTALQWTLNAYTLTLSGLLLLGGSLGDRLGRRRIFLFGTVWFAVASAGCALAPSAGVLIATRALQGIGAALLTPGSLAIMQAVFRKEDRAEAVGAWSGLGGVASAIGPVLGGVLVSVASWGWRLAFLINLPMAAAVVLVAARHVPETRDDEATGRLDVVGAGTAAAGLALVIYALTEGPAQHWPVAVVASLVIGLAVLAAFVGHEMRAPNPMLPMSLFRIRQFTGANLVTLVVYAALS